MAEMKSQPQHRYLVYVLSYTNGIAKERLDGSYNSLKQAERRAYEIARFSRTELGVVRDRALSGKGQIGGVPGLCIVTYVQRKNQAVEAVRTEEDVVAGAPIRTYNEAKGVWETA